MACVFVGYDCPGDCKAHPESTEKLIKQMLLVRPLARSRVLEGLRGIMQLDRLARSRLCSHATATGVRRDVGLVMPRGARDSIRWLVCDTLRGRACNVDDIDRRRTVDGHALPV